jgi:hypothetical protein
LKKVIQATPSGSYIAGIYYPDKLKWDGGKMAILIFAKVLNAPN